MYNENKWDFSHINCWVFDLDDTLYPNNSGVWSQIDQKITLYIKNCLQVEEAEAQRLRKHFRQSYGGALNGLIQEYSVDKADYLENVHDVDYSRIAPNPQLGKKIANLPGRKFIFTNGDRPHAERTLKQLEIDNAFEDIFDIVAANYLPKPYIVTYQSFLEQFSINPLKTVMVEDNLANLSTCKTLGMFNVLIADNMPSEAMSFVDIHVSEIDIFMEKIEQLRS